MLEKLEKKMIDRWCSIVAFFFLKKREKKSKIVIDTFWQNRVAEVHHTNKSLLCLPYRIAQILACTPQGSSVLNRLAQKLCSFLRFKLASHKRVRMFCWASFGDTKHTHHKYLLITLVRMLCGHTSGYIVSLSLLNAPFVALIHWAPAGLVFC